MSATTAAIDAGAALCEHVQRQGLVCHVFSDITVSFLNKDYKLHRIILSQSSYFRSLLSGPWKESGKPRVELQIDDHNVTVEGLETAFAYMYGVSPTFTGESVVGVLAAACFLCMENLCEQCVQFMVQGLREETFVAYQQLSEHHCYGHFAERIRDACWTFLCAHGARELVHVLPKLSLQLLCRLLKSDELWVLNESERYKLAKQALVDWKVARLRCLNPSFDSASSKRSRVMKATSRKSTRSTAASPCNKLKESQKSSRHSPREKGNKKEATYEQKLPSHQKEDNAETALRKLQRLWEEDSAEELDASKEGFNMIVDLFTDGGIIFAYMDADEALQARKELEDANMPTDVVNDAIWQNVLLKTRVLKGVDALLLKSSLQDDEDGGSDDEDDEDDDDDDDDSESSDSDDGWSTDRSSQEEEENTINELQAGNVTVNSSKRLSTALIGFSGLEMNQEPFDGKRRKTTGGFSWAAKLDTSMQIDDFPPFRFGAEFCFKEKRWSQVVESECADVFYGGSMWKIVVSNVNNEKKEWFFAVHCRTLQTWEPHAYRDHRKKVHYTAKLYIKTCSGLQCVTGTGQRRSHKQLPSKHAVGMTLTTKDIQKDRPLRIAAVVQLIQD